jgi:hypothetical protein
MKSSSMNALEFSLFTISSSDAGPHCTTTPWMSGARNFAPSPPVIFVVLAHHPLVESFRYQSSQETADSPLVRPGILVQTEQRRGRADDG